MVKISRKKSINFTEEKYSEFLNLFNFLIYEYSIELPALRNILKNKNEFLDDELDNKVDSFINKKEFIDLQFNAFRINLDSVYDRSKKSSPNCICRDESGLMNGECIPCNITGIEFYLLSKQEQFQKEKQEYDQLMKEISSKIYTKLHENC